MDTKFHINNEALLDIKWWLKFSANWNGKALFLEAKWTLAHHLQLYTDASSTIGYGGMVNGLVSHGPKKLSWHAKFGANSGLANVSYSIAITKP